MIEIQTTAVRVVERVLEGRNLTVILESERKARPSLAVSDKAALQDLSYGTLRFLGRLEAQVDRLVQRPITDSRVRVLLLVALYQLQFTKAAPYAVVDHAVRAVQGMGFARAKGLVNGVLRTFLRSPEKFEPAPADLRGHYSYPDWWIAQVRSEYPDEWSSILQSGNEHPPLQLRVNKRRATAASVLAGLSREGLPATQFGDAGIALERAVPVDRIPGFHDGDVSVQDLGAQYAAPLLDLAPAQRVLDACSAPGGKAAHILESAEVELTALDVDPARLARVEENFSRLGLQARALVGDAADPDAWWDGQPFDRILADVPCSASGVVRRHPDIKWLRRADDISRFAAQQAVILDALWRCLSRGGKLLYATCSIFREENGAQVSRFLSRHNDAEALPVTLPGAENGQLIPNELHDGFYYALLRKR